MRFILSLFQQNLFLKNSLVLFSGTMVVNVLNYVFHVFIGRLVSPQEYGEIEALFSLFTIILVPATAITMIATKYSAGFLESANQAEVKNLWRYLNGKTLLYGAALFFFTLLITPLTKSFLKLDDSWPILFLWAAMFFSFLSAITLGILMGWQRFGAVNQMNILITVIKFGGAIMAIQLGSVVAGTMGALAAGIILGYAFSYWHTGKMLRTAPEETLEKTARGSFSTAALKSYVLPAFYATLTIAILGNVDMVFAKHHLDPHASGEYGALTIVSKTIFFLTGVITTVMFAMSSAQNAQFREGFKTLLQATVLVAGVSFGAVAFFWLFPQFVMSIFFGSTYVAVSHFLPLFALSAALYSLGNLFLQYLLSLHETAAARIFLAFAGLEIAVLYLFGNTLYAIILITIFSQLLAVGGGVFFIIRKIFYGQNNFRRHPSL